MNRSQRILSFLWPVAIVAILVTVLYSWIVKPDKTGEPHDVLREAITAADSSKFIPASEFVELIAMRYSIDSDTVKVILTRYHAATDRSDPVGALAGLPKYATNYYLSNGKTPPGFSWFVRNTVLILHQQTSIGVDTIASIILDYFSLDKDNWPWDVPPQKLLKRSQSLPEADSGSMKAAHR